MMSEDDRRELDEAGKTIDRRLRRLAREHKEGLNALMGKLSDKYDVEFSTPEGYSSRRMPLGINLKDRNVEVPLNDWGSGTQNRTQILMSILQANRIKTTNSSDDKIIPIVVIEEPESFLHPSAQSEFGRILRNLSSEFGIQTIVTTHSPYMLNQEDPSSNILLCRLNRRRRPYETQVQRTSGNTWMAPFSEHLGISPDEFKSWRPVFSSYKSKVLLVEGPIDRDYFECFQHHSFDGVSLSTDIEVVPYGGKDTLKNTLLLKFVLDKFDQVFVTYDLDAAGEVKAALNRLGLREGSDFAPLGLNQTGRDSIEGLLPERILATVNGRETDLVMGLHSKKNNERLKAKEKLKKKYLEEFQRQTTFTKDDLKYLGHAVKLINTRFAKKQRKHS
jgi:predicted ATP-dependent endonuclease of OLD family